MKLRKAMAFGFAAILALSVAGCGNNTGEANGAATGTPSKVESTAAGTTDTAETGTEEGGIPSYSQLDLDEDYPLTASIKWIHHKTDREEDGTIAKYIAAFNEAYPNITVTTEGITDYAQDALLRLSTGDWGDVMFIPAVDKKDLSTYFYPMDSLENLDKEINFANQWEYGGQSYGVPYMGNAQGIVYNKAVFEAAGITKLPVTSEEFLAGLKAIREKTDAIPLYTNYAAGWTMGAWDAYIGIVTNGDNTYMNQKLVHTAEPFANPGDGTGIYSLYNTLYSAVSDGLTEEDYTTTDWEGCKGMINNGQIGCMVLGSWAFSQMVDAGEHGEDIGYMPFPITVNGVQYANAGADYSFAINANSSDVNKTASMIFIKWMTERSGWCYDEGGYTVDKNGKNPPLYEAFNGATLMVDEPAVAGEEDLLNKMNAESELSFNAGGDAKVQRIIEAAATGSKSFDDVMKDWTAAWKDAQETLGVEVKY